MKFFSLLGGCALLLSGVVCAQESVGPATLNAGGGGAVVAGNTYEWSIGEMALVATASNGSGLIVTQGVLQPLDLSLNMDDATRLSRLMQVYPNPASEVLYLAYTPVQTGKLQVLLTDITGRRLYQQAFEVYTGQLFQASLSMQSYAQGQYLLTAWEDPHQKQKASFKITKTH